MALTAEECDEMVAAAQRAERQLLIGHVLPFFPEYQFAYQAMLSGDYGKLLGGTFKRVISDPTWLADFYDPAKVGGPLIDLHVHDAHFIRLLFGMPVSLYSRGRMRGEVVEYCHTQFSFADPDVVVSAVSGVVQQQGRTFTHGFEIHFERATLQYESAVINDDSELLMPLTVFTAAGEAVRPDIVESDAFIAEMQEVEVAIESGRPSSLLGGELARDAIVLCQRQTDSVRAGRPLEVA
jgi:predicted dehydrogenase